MRQIGRNPAQSRPLLANGQMGDNQVGMEHLSSIRPQMTQDGVLFYDSRYISDDEQVKQLLRGTTPVRFDWENKWLRGD